MINEIANAYKRTSMMAHYLYDMLRAGLLGHHASHINIEA
jgi:hypothetical protein